MGKTLFGCVALLWIALLATASGCIAQQTDEESGPLDEGQGAENGPGVEPQDVPPPWEHRQNTCDSLSFYGVNPAYNPGVSPTHLLGKYKRLYYTTGSIVNGWVPVYSAGQEDWHTGWVRQECLVNGWPYPQSGSVIY